MEVSHTVVDGVATVRLEAPQRRNALTPEMANDLRAVLDLIDGDPSVGAVVLTGDGDGFCAGAELATLTSAQSDPLSDDNFGALDAIYSAFVRFGSMSIPTIAAINGAAVGAGLNLALAADLRIVADNALLLSGFARIGIHPGGGHFHLLGRMIGRDAIVAMAFFDEPIAADRAVQLGLAWRSVPLSSLMKEAQRVAARVGRRPGLARDLVRSLRNELPGTVSWEASVLIERTPQLRSLRQRSLS